MSSLTPNRWSFARSAILCVALFTSLACFGGGSCNDDGDQFQPPPGPTITSVYPCAALPSEEVRINGSRLGGASVTIGGKQATVVSGGDDHVIVRVAADASGSGLLLTTLTGSESSVFKVLTDVAVAEVEPNDDINGADATNTLSERKGSGSLATVNDRDHFRVDCLDPLSAYKIKVTPATFGPVFVDGAAVTLDANGEGVIISGRTDHVIGFTGHQGAYSFELTRIP